MMKNQKNKSKKIKFTNKSPCELTVQNMDRSCGLDPCIACDYDSEIPYSEKWFNKFKILAICEAPWVGGLSKKTERPLAIVYECPNCFEKFWFHTTKGHKETLEYLLREGVIK